MKVAIRAVPAEVGVSAREAEVLAALAQHLTNAEIGARLFISIRTVESHVSSLLRKLQVDDRRALAAVAATLQPAGAIGMAATVATAQPLTPFVGRVTERAALIQALDTHRLITAVGPGGVGKTRLALNVATDVSDRFADGAWFVDLVPVTDAEMVSSAIAAALGLGEHQGCTANDTLLRWFAEREALLVLDNCEHVLDCVAALLERLLEGSPRLSVLVTSRARLLVPFEWVFPVPGLSVGADDGDAVELFLARTAASGATLWPEDKARIAAICSRLDGMALAIELAAARVASLGLDGIEAGLADQLRLLTGGSRADDRHRSLRATMDWSYALLDDASRAVLRRISVFAGPFTATAAAAVLGGWPPVPAGAVATILGELAEHSLLVASAEPGGTRYRAQETIRQYGFDRLEDAKESAEALSRHLRWCLDTAAGLDVPARSNEGAWRSAFDQVVDELRSSLGWAAGEPQHRSDAYRLAIRLAELTFARGMPGESQARYEQAATLAGDDAAAASALHWAAGAAESRHFGTASLRLRRAAAAAALRAGDRAGAARDLARAAEMINRGSGLMATPPTAGEVDALLEQAAALAVGDLAAEAATMTAVAFNRPDFDPVSADLADQAMALARLAGDPLIESAALDQLTSVQLAMGNVRAAAGSSLRRTELLAREPMTAAAGIEFADAFAMAAECAVAIGDLDCARQLAERIQQLPFYREEGHLASARLMLVTALAGDWDEACALSERFLEGWERAGRPRAGNLSRAAYALATIHGLRGDDDARATWLAIVQALRSPGVSLSSMHFGEFFDAWLLLHRGEFEQAMQLLSTPPEEFRTWHSGLWRPWYSGLWVEAAVLSGSSDAAERIVRGRALTQDNPIAAAIVDRAAALAGDHDGLVPAATALQAAGCRYQWARTLVLIGGDQELQGKSVLAEMGASPMAAMASPRG